ncbi:hypothetical protein AOLI_G00174470 [Acnodon oligacanthus]
MDPTTRLRCGGLWLAASTAWQERSKPSESIRTSFKISFEARCSPLSALSAAEQAGACSSARSTPVRLHLHLGREGAREQRRRGRRCREAAAEGLQHYRGLRRTE